MKTPRFHPELFARRDYRRYWTGSVVSNFGNALSSVVYAVLVYRLTGSSGAMGLTLALAVLPTLFSPLFGVWVDRLPLRPVLVGLNLAQAASIGGLALLVTLDAASVGWIYLASLLGGLATAAYTPAAGTVLPRLVGKDDLVRASGTLSAANQTSYLLGYLGGAALASLLGAAGTLALDALSFALLAWMVAGLHLAPLPTAPVRTPYWTAFGAGVQVIRQAGLFTLVPLMAFAVNAALAPTEMLLPRQLTLVDQPTSGYGLFMGLMMGGMVLGSSTVGWLGARFVPRSAIAVGAAVLGAGLAGTGLARDVGLYGWALVYGYGLALVNGGIGVLAQTVVAPEVRGRVIGLVNAVAHLGLPLSLLLLAPVADHLAPAWILGTAGVLLCGAALVWWRGTARYAGNGGRAAEATD